MPPNIPRPLISVIGLAIGFGLYTLAGRLAEPWQSVLIGVLFGMLGVSAWIYAQGERWIQVLGVLLLGWGVIRMFFLR